MCDFKSMSRDFTREFIELYRSEPCLWKTDSKVYADRNKKHAAYGLLVKKLKTIQPDATKHSVVTKINTLRGCFRREYKKILESKQSGDDVYVPKLWYFDQLLFLKDKECPRKSTSDIDEKNTFDLQSVDDEDKNVDGEQDYLGFPISNTSELSESSQSSSTISNETPRNNSLKRVAHRVDICDFKSMSRDFTREFIELYRSEPCLWQTKSKIYADRNKKHAAYNLLVNKLKTIQPDATKHSVISKINTLRGCFRREYKKIIESKRNGGDVYVPSLWYFNQLLFLKDKENLRKSTSNIDEKNALDFQSVYDEDKNVDGEQDYLGFPISNTSELSESSQSSSTISNETPRNNSLKRKAPSKTDEILNIVGERINNLDDEFTVIGKSIALKLRRFPKETKIYAEKLIFDVLFQAELGRINENTRIAHGSKQSSQNL